MKWDMKARIDKINELQEEYPELKRAREIVNHVLSLDNMWTDDNEVEKEFEKLENILEDVKKYDFNCKKCNHVLTVDENKMNDLENCYCPECGEEGELNWRFQGVS